MPRENFTFPPKHKLQIHAKSIHDLLPTVKYNEAQQLVSLLYKCRDWTQLMSCVDDPAKLSAIDNSWVMAAESYIDGQNCRNELQVLINAAWSQELKKLEEFPLGRHTVAEAISNLKVDWLLDREAILLHSLVFRFPDEPMTDLYAVFEHVDNNILSKIFYMEIKGMTYSNAHLYDHRFGLKFYYHLTIDDSHIKLVIREFDTYFGEDKLSGKEFDLPWFFNYVNAYVLLLAARLKEMNYEYEIILEKVNNIYVSELNVLNTTFSSDVT